MKTNHLIDPARRVYAWLLRLYPQEYRAEYGESMIQVFTDQCREASRQHGAWDIFALYIRTLFDLGKTALREHLASSQARDGLLAAFPGAPLPWKKVAQILIPSFVFLFAYTLNVLTNNRSWGNLFDWSIYLFTGMALLVFWRNNRIPLWGLIPLGLFINIFINLIYNLPTTVFKYYGLGNLIIIVIIILTIPCLLYLQTRRQKISRAAWLWLGIYIVICIGRAAIAYSYTIEHSPWTRYSLFGPQNGYTGFIPIYFADSVFSATKSLLFIFLGTLFTRRYGSLSILFLMSISFTNGWLIFGQSQDYILYSLTFIYNLAISIGFPIWIARSPFRKEQTKAITSLFLFSFITFSILEMIRSQGMFLHVSSPVANPPILIIYPIISAFLVGVKYLLAASLYRSMNKIPVRISMAEVPEPSKN
jgi:hypothetical protein